VKVILTKDVDKIGKSGEMKTVADGFATNFLIPRSLAVPAAAAPIAPGSDIASREDRPTRARRRRDRSDPHRLDHAHAWRQGRRRRQAVRLGTKEIASPRPARIVVDRTRSSSRALKTLGTYKVAVKVYSGLTLKSRWSSSPRADDS
jgi:large subunit ribosomal protein L9